MASIQYPHGYENSYARILNNFARLREEHEECTVSLQLLDAEEIKQKSRNLRTMIRTSYLERDVQRIFLGMLNLMAHISQRLPLQSHVLRQDVKREIQDIAKLLFKGIKDVLKFTNRKIKNTEAALSDLESAIIDEPSSSRSSRASSQGARRKLHDPTGFEVRLWCGMAAYYDMSVYNPFWQLHLAEPDHGVWQLDGHLTPIYLIIHDLVQATRLVDHLVLAYDQEDRKIIDQSFMLEMRLHKGLKRVQEQCERRASGSETAETAETDDGEQVLMMAPTIKVKDFAETRSKHEGGVYSGNMLPKSTMGVDELKRSISPAPPRISKENSLSSPPLILSRSASHSPSRSVPISMYPGRSSPRQRVDTI